MSNFNLRNPFKRRSDEWFRFDSPKRFTLVKDKGGVISPPGECVWMFLDVYGPWMYLDKSFLGLAKKVIFEWKSDKHIA